MAHQLGRLHVAIVAEDLDAAIALRGRADRLARERFRAVLARVADELVPEALDVRLDRLALDLGAITAERLEEDGGAAFEQMLRNVLGAALADARAVPRTGVRALAPAEAACGDLAAYFRRGTAYAGFDLAASLSRALERPAALAAALHGLGGDGRAIERLVLQLGEAELRALLQLLAPADAALILRYHAELRGLHRATPAPPPDPVVHRVTWVLTFEYLLRDAGSQFNRRAFVAHLLRGFAAELGIAYGELLARVRDALAATRRRQPVSASLPAVLDALIAQHGAAAPQPEVPDARGAPLDPVALLVARLRAAAHDRAVLAVLVRGLSANLFAAAIRRLEPQHAATILRHLETLATLHADRPFVALPPDALLFQLRLITVRHLLHNAGTRFNRRSWMQRLLRGIAVVAGMALGTLVEAITVAVAELRRSRPVEGDFAVAMQDLVAAVPGAPALAADADTTALLVARLRRRPDGRAGAALAAGVSRATFAALVRELAPARASAVLGAIDALLDAHRRGAIVPASPEALARAVQRLTASWLAEHGAGASLAQWRRDVAEALGRQFGAPLSVVVAAMGGAPLDGAAQTGAVPPPPSPGADAAALRAYLALHPDRCRAFVVCLGEDAWVATVALLMPRPEPLHADLSALEEACAERAFGNMPRAALRQLLRMLAIEVLARVPNADRAAWRRALLDGLARHQGWVTHALGGWRQMVRRGAAPPAAPAEDGSALERYLRRGARSGRRAALAALARHDAAGLAVLVRQIAAARPGGVAALVARLLRLLPGDEALALLRPDLTSAQAAGLAFAWDAHPAGAQWQQLIVAMIEAGPAGTPALPPGTVSALLRRWTAGDADLPGFLDPGDALLALDPAMLVHLFGGASGDQRLRRAVARLGSARGGALLRRLGEALALPGAAHDLDAIATHLSVRAGAAAEAPAEPDFAAMLRWLEGETVRAPSASARARWIALLQRAAAGGDPRVDAALRRGLARGAARARWTELPEAALDAVLRRIAPARAALLLELRRLLADAWRATTPARAGEGERLLAAAIFDLLARGEPSSIRAAADALIAALRPGDAAAAHALRTRATWRARQAGQSHLAAAFTPPVPPPDAAARATRAADPDGDAPIYVANAGLVLFAPFLPMLFERLGVLTQGEDGKPAIAGIDALSRAVHLLQLCVAGRADAPEPALALNKLLAGAAVADPVAPGVTVSDEDRATCDGLVRAVIANWTIIRNTSPAGLRETFLQRPGRLERSEHGWTLTVERRTVDVLVDQVPWSFSTILHGWMPEVMHVVW